MRVSDEFKADTNAELVVRTETELLGRVSSSRRISEIKKALRPSLGVLRSAATAARQSKDYAGLLKIREESVKVYPEDCRELNELAWDLLTIEDVSLRNPKRALEFARKAADLSMQKDDGILDTLALALHDTGAIEEALKYEEMAVKLKPGNEYIKRCEQYKAELEAKKTPADKGAATQ